MSTDRKEHPFFRRYPELHLFPRPEEATEALTRAKHELMKTWRFWCFNAFTFVGLVGLWIGGMTVLARYVPVPPWVRFSLDPIVVFFVFGGHHWVYTAKIRRLLRKDLVARGIAVCLECGYDLRGQVDPRCSECGTPFESRLLKQRRAGRSTRVVDGDSTT